MHGRFTALLNCKTTRVEQSKWLQHFTKLCKNYYYVKNIIILIISAGSSFTHMCHVCHSHLLLHFSECEIQT